MMQTPPMGRAPCEWLRRSDPLIAGQSSWCARATREIRRAYGFFKRAISDRGLAQSCRHACAVPCRMVNPIRQSRCDYSKSAIWLVTILAVLYLPHHLDILAGMIMAIIG